MVVRKYYRRNRGIAGTCSDTATISDSEHGFGAPMSQGSPHEAFNFGFSSQDSSSWSFDPEEPFGSSQVSLPVGGDQKEKRERSGKNNSKPVFGKRRRMPPSPSPATAMATLMETQESGQIMEHVDEVNFALDGLRGGQPVRIRRASLLSLLSICATAEQRQLLRDQGMAKTIIDGIQCLSMDDSPSTLAAAALFYILTSDSPDNLLLESPSSITFLIKLLKPVRADTNNGKAPSIGSKLLALCKEFDTLKDTSKRLDSGSAEIVRKVEEILVKCKELKSSVGYGSGMGRPELSPKWIALLTMEKASSSTISLEDTFGTMTKTGGNFKENLREYGGLDAIFDVALDCHSILEGKFRRCSLNQNIKDNADAQSLVLFLKFLKVMENSTFLNKDNQIHLLGMRKKLKHQKPLSFIELVISMIKTLSGLFLDENSSEDKSYKFSNGISCSSDMALVVDRRALGGETSSKLLNMKSTSSEKRSSLHQNSLSFSTAQLVSSGFISHSSDSCTVTSRSSNRGRQVSENGSRDKFALGKHPIASEEIGILENSEDPFAFDEEDFEPSNWGFLSGKQKVSQTQKSMAVHEEPENGFESSVTMSQHEPSNDHCRHFEMSCSAIADDELSDLLANCLITAVKVLMNLANDNPVGCQQIATCGGLETMSTLIPSHFPLFSSSPSPSPSAFSEALQSDSLSQSTIDPDNQNDRHLTEQQMDFLVAILGLLVNLVEKDSHNRSRLAAAIVLLPSSQRLNKESHKDVISLLCSIFLANQGAGEAADEGSLVSENDEAALLLGEKEAEKTIIEAYSALLLAFLCSESKSIRKSIADRLPQHNLAILVPVLERFLAFHLTLNMISPETHTAVSEVIESCKVP